MLLTITELGARSEYGAGRVTRVSNTATLAVGRDRSDDVRDESRGEEDEEAHFLNESV